MDDLVKAAVDKISSYNLFNYLFPGAVFIVALDCIVETNVLGHGIVIGILVAYFAGMVLSRIGSLFVESLFERLRIVKLCNYSEFLAAEKKDPKLTTLLQENNTFRTMTATFLMLLPAKVTALLIREYPELSVSLGWAWPIALLLLFALSYGKQSAYIVKRVTQSTK